jgi:hypothetical protein
VTLINTAKYLGACSNKKHGKYEGKEKLAFLKTGVLFLQNTHLKELFSFNSHSGGWSPTEATRHVGTLAIYWPSVPAPGDYDDGEAAGMKIGRGNRSTRRKPAPAPLRPPQITFNQTRARTRAAAVGSPRLTA